MSSSNHERCKMVVRQWHILKRLEQVPSTLSELAAVSDEGVVSERTIRRDLEALEAARFPLYTEPDASGRLRWHLLTKGVAPARRAE